MKTHTDFKSDCIKYPFNHGLLWVHGRFGQFGHLHGKNYEKPSVPGGKKRGKGLEKVYLRVFGLRKVRKMTKNAETAKNTIQTVFDPSFFHTTLGGALGNRASKKN